MKLIRLPAVMESTGYRKSMIYRLINEGSFPKPVQLGARAVAWIDEEVKAWIQERIDLSRCNLSSKQPVGKIISNQPMAHSFERRR